jgi:hypothetical protein
MVNAYTKRKQQTIITLFIVSIVILSSALATSAQGIYYLEIGADGDSGSQNNIGVRAEIRTHVYNGSLYEDASGEEHVGDVFVVAEPFSDGSIMYFGYYLYSGHAQWSWQRLGSDGRVEDGGVGSVGAVEPNGTWHTYSIVRESQMALAQGTWNFVLDNNYVGFTQQTIDERKATTGPVFVMAEKVTVDTTEFVLGPVEFRNLAYLKSDGWHPVASLRVRAYCSNKPAGRCNIDYPYGVSELGANHIIAGSGMPRHANGELLWASNPFDYLVPYLVPIGLAVLVIILAYFSIRKIPIYLPRNRKPY